jgi:hypothetical protein
MNEHDLSMVLNLQRFVLAGASEASNGQDDSLTASIQRGAKAVADAGTPITGHCESFDPETTVTFVRKEAERTLNDAAFIDNMSAE